MINFKQNNYNPTEIIHPGASLDEVLRALNMTQAELAKRTDRPIKTINEIVNGTAAITPETAIQFERALGVSASFWNNLEKNYQEMRARFVMKEKLKEEYVIARQYPLAFMMKRKWIKYSENIEEITEQLLTYFGVNSLKLVNKVQAIAYRNHKGKIDEFGLQAWLRKGEIDSYQIETAAFNETKLKEVLNKIRSFTNKNPEAYLTELRQMLADCGIAVIFTPMIPKTYVCGSARWLSSNKALVQLSLRGSYADIMWFTLFHELGHVLLHGKKIRHIDFEGKRESSNIEAEADNFASEQLIPKKDYEELLTIDYKQSAAIKGYAERIGVSPGVVVGRLQHDGLIKYQELSNLREKYKFIEA